MRRKHVRSLSLAKETVRALEPAPLGQAAGGCSTRTAAISCQGAGCPTFGVTCNQGCSLPC